ncbi:MAG: CHASE3 domain-containing protein [Proteobacteria bacterium]|nr:CHASE3 domain-containing protein [Pseudomonadota bacterium]MBS0611268.1 CHASE3 domain-containing protein [Pseudomonadota bacterium]
MFWTRLRKMAVSLPVALMAVVLLVGINETGYLRSHDAVEELARSQATRAALDRLLQSMLNAETGLRGYLLTGDERYLQPYQQAVATINSNLDELHQAYQRQPGDQADFAQLSQQIARKLSELQLILQLRRQDNDDAWRFVLSTDVGKDNMDAIRTLAARLVDHSAQQSQGSTQEILHSLRLSRLGIATVAVIGLLAFYMYLRQTYALQEAHEREQQALARERDRLEQLVRERTATLSELANHLQQVREDERAYLARELHDELGALLTAAKLDVARLKSRIDMQVPEHAARVQHLTETLNNGIALKRRIIENLRPSSLSNLGLTAALEILARDFATSSSLQVDTSLDEVPLSDTAQLTVYRLVQESLTNVGKYADAHKVLVCVHKHPNHVAVQVRDDGKGFDPAAIRADAYGLLGMRHRVEAAGGSLTVSSTPGEGTLVCAVLPIRPA